MAAAYSLFDVSVRNGVGRGANATGEAPVLPPAGQRILIYDSMLKTTTSLLVSVANWRRSPVEMTAIAAEGRSTRVTFWTPAELISRIIACRPDARTIAPPGRK